MKLKFFDTYDRRVREFLSLEQNKVKMYACGPTVYDYAHIGNLRTYLFEDILKRTLLLNGYEVEHVINITDVGHLVSDGDEGEDKMELGSKRSGMNAWDLAQFFTDAFQADLRKLNILPPNIWCKATDHIPEQIDFVKELEAKGFTYELTDGIYFDSKKLKNYGHLARLDIGGLQEGARVEKGEDVVKVGDQVTVRVREIDSRGRINLTLRGVAQNGGMSYPEPTPTPVAPLN